MDYLWRSLLLVSASATILLGACGFSGKAATGAGGNSAGTGTGGLPAGGAGGGLAGGNGSGGQAGGGGSSSLAGGGGTGGAGTCGDTTSDPANCGRCGNVCPSGQSCSQSRCTCPPYQDYCAGACIPTSVDPNNCGGCGITCTTGQACSAGGCSSTCLPGLTICGRACTDLQNDSSNCGACGTICGTGQGCTNGKCAASVPVGPAPAKCTGGGPPISVDPTQGGCLGSLAQTTFRWALCSCTDLDVSAPLMTDAFDSTKAPYQPGQLGGGVGVDGDVTHWSQAVTVGGVLWDSGGGNYQSSGPASEIKSDMHLAGSWNASSPFTVDGNALVTGTLSGVTVNGMTSHPASVPQPCDCTQSTLVPVTAIVAAHRSPNNDDAAIQLDPTVFQSPSAPLRLDLPCGNYYLTQITTATSLTIAAHGRTALYIDGDVTPSAPIAFVLDPTAELDVFIAGTINSSQTIVIGSPNYPALSRTYIGGTASLKFSQNVSIGGEIYAAESQLVDWSANNEIYGSVFAGNFKASQNTSIHYDRGVLQDGISCPQPKGDAGVPTCGSCRDCGNQACINGTCGACQTSADCCAPLACVNGSCELVITIN